MRPPQSFIPGLVNLAPLLITAASSSEFSDDWAFVKRCVCGDTEAFRPLVQKYQRLAYSVSLRMMRSHADAEDVVQQSFIAAFRALPRFDGSQHERAFRVWLLRIVVNRAKDSLKARRSRDVQLSDETQAGSLQECSAQDPESLASQRSEAHRLEVGLASLAEKYRTCLVLKDVEDLSYEEMHAVLRLPITTLKIRVVRARAMLRAWLIEQEGT